MSNGSVTSENNVPRLCHIIQWKHFDGYGFNLHAEKGKPGQYIGKVDEGSPAEAAGLKQGDRIIEVNGVNIANENHKQVVQRIKAIAQETKLLVVDSETDKYYQSLDIIVKSSLPEVKYIKTPLDPVITDSKEENKTTSDNNIFINDGSTGSNDLYPEQNGSNAHSSPVYERKNGSSNSEENGASNQVGHKNEDSSTSSHENRNNMNANNKLNSSINLNMTAKELREMLAKKKKHDPKNTSMDFKQKFNIVQEL